MGEDALTRRPSLLMAWGCSRSEDDPGAGAWLGSRWGHSGVAPSPPVVPRVAVPSQPRGAGFKWAALALCTCSPHVQGTALGWQERASTRGAGSTTAFPEHHQDAAVCYAPAPGAGHRPSHSHPACKRPFKGVAESKEQQPWAWPGLAGLAQSTHRDTPLPRSPPWPQVRLVRWLQERNPAAAGMRRPRSCRACVSACVRVPPQVQRLHVL